MVCQSAPPASSPAPRLRARSMLSLGTEFFLAFWMASYSVGLPPGSPPPTRAATSMFLISRAKFLPRRASMTAFLCFVVAHLEWPLMQVLPLSLTSESDQRVYVDVYPLPNGVGAPAWRGIAICVQVVALSALNCTQVAIRRASWTAGPSPRATRRRRGSL